MLAFFTCLESYTIKAVAYLWYWLQFLFLIGLTHGASETGFFYKNTSLQPADWVKNPVSFVRVHSGLFEKRSALTASKIWLSISMLGEPVVVN
ncbi:hypothetical protein QUB08_07975 [Microcoleus sp. BR0-C5]|uniref:hypothetical protein n=1 Tax=Microcoleus sp. BR0-C5 TaxID=2818713 RepID=UPI002FD4E30F